MCWDLAQEVVSYAGEISRRDGIRIDVWLANDGLMLQAVRETPTGVRRRGRAVPYEDLHHEAAEAKRSIDALALELLAA